MSATLREALRDFIAGCEALTAFEFESLTNDVDKGAYIARQDAARDIGAILAAHPVQQAAEAAHTHDPYCCCSYEARKGDAPRCPACSVHLSAVQS